jgi:NAD(P)H-hydrate epimerase
MTNTTLTIPERLKLVSVAEMQAIEKAADAAGHSYAVMMELAGEAVARAVLAHYGALRPGVLVLVGPGNNGGDGLVCARYLCQAGLSVRVYLWKRRTEPAHDYEQHFAKVAQLGIDTAHADSDPEFSTLRAWLEQSSILVDAVLGTGANRPIGGQLAELLEVVRAAKAARPHLDSVAVDCASGLNCDTGVVDPQTAPAALTVTFAYAKYGHYQFPGVDVTGVLEVADIGVYPYVADTLKTFLIDADVVRPWLPARPNVSHKGTFGKAMAAVGSVNYPGAAFLSCAAAGRVGAGLVTGAVAQPVWNIVAGRLAEPTWQPLPSGAGAEAGVIDERAAPVLANALSGYDVLLLGCGLGQLPTTQRFVHALLGQSDLPALVIDADGLNCLAKLENWPQWLPANTILTPHAAEMGRLCHRSVADVLSQRWTLAREKAAEWNVVLLVKGPYTVVAHPQGWLAVLPIATAALATAGTGDVLAGTITGLIAQKVDPFQATCLGAWLHGVAGQRCQAEVGPAGVVASDLLPRLPAMMNLLRMGG